ncbi:MAG: helix-turn-helix domain-containing protein [Clostridiales bacterium]|nr:helix-turn-helix domain-containing protein [Clostridiales bacterium]
MDRIKILVADDERIERAILCKKISREFGDVCELVQAENGCEAMRVFTEEGDVAAAVLDIAMPGLSGIEVAAKIRERDRDCLLIFLTAYSDFHYTRQAIRLHALDYLTKPYEDEELYTVIEEAVHLAQIRRSAEGRSDMADVRPTRLSEKPQPVSDGETEAKEEPVEEAEPSVEHADVRLTTDITKEISDFIAKNYMHEISMQDAARYMNYSDSYFCKLFKQGFGTNFTTYLTTFRMQEAARLLKNTDLSVHEISVRTGYPDPNYFSKVFKRHNGMIPRDYRRSQDSQDGVALTTF